MTTNQQKAADLIMGGIIFNQSGTMGQAVDAIAQALADAGLLAPDLPDLPEPQTFPNGEREWSSLIGFVNLDTDGTITVVYDERDEDDIAAGAEIDPGELVFTRISEAEILARAFLAATNQAEKDMSE